MAFYMPVAFNVEDSKDMILNSISAKLKNPENTKGITEHTEQKLNASKLDELAHAPVEEDANELEVDVELENTIPQLK